MEDLEQFLYQRKGNLLLIMKNFNIHRKTYNTIILIRSLSYLKTKMSLVKRLLNYNLGLLKIPKRMVCFRTFCYRSIYLNILRLILPVS